MPSVQQQPEEPCLWCQRAHLLKHCPRLVKLTALDRLEKEIRHVEDGEDKLAGLRAIAAMRVAHAELAVDRARETLADLKAKLATEQGHFYALDYAYNRFMPPRPDEEAEPGADANSKPALKSSRS